MEWLTQITTNIIAMMGSSGGGKTSQSGSGIEMFLPMIIIFAIFYFLLIRPQAKKQKQHQSMLTELKRGDRIITTGGIYGTIVGITDENLHLKIADKTKIQITRSSVGKKVNETDEA